MFIYKITNKVNGKIYIGQVYNKKEVFLMTHKEISLNTKKKLASALKQAMKKKPFGKIAVSELIKTCGINRNTFYYHFEDIYALLK